VQRRNIDSVARIERSEASEIQEAALAETPTRVHWPLHGGGTEGVCRNSKINPMQSAAKGRAEQNPRTNPMQRAPCGPDHKSAEQPHAKGHRAGRPKIRGTTPCKGPGWNPREPGPAFGYISVTHGPT